MTEPLRILNVGGHPKDVISYAGGAMAKHAARGDRVCMLTPFTGLALHHKAIDHYNETGDRPDLDALVEERRQELIDASAELGISDVRFLAYPDDIPVVDRRIVSDIADVIGEVRPDFVLTHNPYDFVPAHANATHMTMMAIDAAGGLRANKAYPPHSVKQIFYYAQQGRNLQETVYARVPTTLVEITDVVHKKANAMNKFTHQHYGEDTHLQRKLGEALDGGLHAIIARVPYAESFIAHYPQVYKSLSVSDYTLELSKKSQAEGLEYMTQMLLDEY